MPDFQPIYQRAAERKGGDKALKALLPELADPGRLAALPDRRFLAEMTKCIFRSGFVWRVIEQKWPDFEIVFHGFDPARLAFEPDDYWADVAADKRIVRNAIKIKSVRDNARFVLDVAAKHGSFGRFLADWPLDDQLGLLAYLAKHGSRLGGMTGQYFLRAVGRDSYILSADVVAALRDAGLEIADNPTSKGDRAKIQQRFNAWRDETGLSLTQLSRVLAMSVGENYDAEYLNQRTSAFGEA